MGHFLPCGRSTFVALSGGGSRVDFTAWALEDIKL